MFAFLAGGIVVFTGSDFVSAFVVAGIAAFTSAVGCVTGGWRLKGAGALAGMGAMIGTVRCTEVK